MSSSRTLRGLAAARSPGIVIGRAQRVMAGQQPVVKKHIAAGEVEAEIERLEDAIVASVADVDAERLHLMELESQEPLHILDAQRLMLLDPDLSQKVRERIEAEHINAEWALRQQIDAIVAVFEHIDDTYLRARKADIEQVGMRILHHLLGCADKPPRPENGEPVILIGEDFTPLQIMRLWRHGIAGFIAAQGGANSHSIIIARGLGLPGLMGADDVTNLVQDGDPIILDGEHGLWISNPDAEELAEYRHFIQGISAHREDLRIYAQQPSRSADGHIVKLMANLEVDDEVPLALELGAEGVGLYRTEFLLSDSDDFPDEEVQYAHYSTVLKGMKGLPVTFRLLDIGGEKPILFRQITGHSASGPNPALGLRGVRLLLRHTDVLRSQLRALLRASEAGEAQILIPMVSYPEEVLEVRRIMEECAAELGIKDLPPLGTMIEVPAAVILAEDLAKICDFFSVGTNDLVQYTMAADRADEEVAYLHEAAPKAVERMLRDTSRAAKKAGIPIAICGELAADIEWTERLMNMGFDSLSMSLNHILPVRKHLRRLHYHPEGDRIGS